jgi:UDP-N-acetylmuramyl pentapeptide phosphotransferase/UDP-N-acetylglucosamine-1-phosphate transferase
MTSAVRFALSFVISFVLALGSSLLWPRLLRGPGWVAQPRPDRHHSQATPKSGGPAWLTGALLGLLLLPDHRVGLILTVGLSLAALLGRLDDRGKIGPGPKWLFQTALLGAAFFLLAPSSIGSLRTGPGIVIVATVLALQTALGIFDNLDGALGLVAFFGFLGFAAYGQVRPACGVVQPEAALVGAGATLGFLIRNRPPARHFLGNLGSQPVSFLVTLLVLIALAAGADNGGVCNAGVQAPRPDGAPLDSWGAIPWFLLLPLGWPLLDLGYVTLRRLRRGIPPWRGGRDHTTHALARRLGSDGRAALVILAVEIASLAAVAALTCRGD